jgi:hypothetical protein
MSLLHDPWSQAGNRPEIAYSIIAFGALVTLASAILWRHRSTSS